MINILEYYKVQNSFLTNVILYNSYIINFITKVYNIFKDSDNNNFNDQVASKFFFIYKNYINIYKYSYFLVNKFFHNLNLAVYSIYSLNNVIFNFLFLQDYNFKDSNQLLINLKNKEYLFAINFNKNISYLKKIIKKKGRRKIVKLIKSFSIDNQDKLIKLKKNSSLVYDKVKFMLLQRYYDYIYKYNYSKNKRMLNFYQENLPRDAYINKLQFVKNTIRIFKNSIYFKKYYPFISFKFFRKYLDIILF